MSERIYVIRVKTTEINYGSDELSKAQSKEMDDFIHGSIKGFIERRLALDDMLGDELVEEHNENFDPEVDDTDQLGGIEIEVLQAKQTQSK